MPIPAWQMLRKRSKGVPLPSLCVGRWCCASASCDGSCPGWEGWLQERATCSASQAVTLQGSHFTLIPLADWAVTLFAVYIFRWSHTPKINRNGESGAKCAFFSAHKTSRDTSCQEIRLRLLHCSLSCFAGGKQCAATKCSPCFPSLCIVRIYQKWGFEENSVLLEAEYVMIKI